MSCRKREQGQAIASKAALHAVNNRSRTRMKAGSPIRTSPDALFFGKPNYGNLKRLSALDIRLNIAGIERATREGGGPQHGKPNAREARSDTSASESHRGKGSCQGIASDLGKVGSMTSQG